MVFQLLTDGSAAIIQQRVRKVRTPKRVKAVQELVATAAILGVTLTRKPGKLEQQWVKWAKAARTRR